MKRAVKSKPRSTNSRIKLIVVVLLLISVICLWYLSLNGDKTPQKVEVSSTTKGQAASKQLVSLQDVLKSQQETKVNLIYGQKKIKASPQTVSDWYKPTGKSFELSEGIIRNYIQRTGSSMGITVENLDQAVFQVKNAVLTTAQADVVLNASGITKNYTYCAQLRGVDTTYLPAFISTLQEIYSDPRGWSLGGQVSFKRANQGCSFTIWLSAANEMGSFGGVCDSDWSCRAGDNVVINFNRWRFASSSWLASGNNIHNYRVLAVNHETGHWFGFNHLACPASGTPAPVMMQQSVDLQGCKFNWWPLEIELNTLRSNLGLL